jgi:hypothetical protein
MPPSACIKPDDDAASSVAVDIRMMQQVQPKSAATRADATTVRSSSWPTRHGWNIALYQFRCRVPLRDVQEAASHADPRTTMRCAGQGIPGPARQLHRRRLRRRGRPVKGSPAMPVRLAVHWPGGPAGNPGVQTRHVCAQANAREPPNWTTCGSCSMIANAAQNNHSVEPKAAAITTAQELGPSRRARGAAAFIGRLPQRAHRAQSRVHSAEALLPRRLHPRLVARLRRGPRRSRGPRLIDVQHYRAGP